MIIYLLICILLVSVGFLTIFWAVHISQVKEFTTNYGWASFIDFKREFIRYNWNNEGWSGNSVWDRDGKCEFHANVVKFNSVGMIMRTPIDYIAMIIFANHYIRVSIKLKDKKIRNYNWSRK